MSRNTTPEDWRLFLSSNTIVLDGGLATSLEAVGHDLSGSLWSARILVERPEAVVAVHESHARAGAQILTSASYQVSEHGFVSAGLTVQAAQDSIYRSIDVARTAAETVEAEDGIVRYVAASVGPWGATLADGSEYRGDYTATESEIFEFHAQRLEMFLQAKPDLIAIETVPSLRELRAVNRALHELNVAIPTWVSCSALNATTICDGTSISEARGALNHDSLIAFGFNCTAPEHIEELVRAASDALEPLPVVVYPNAGRTWDATARKWLDEGSECFSDTVLESWISAGARIVGGCCGLGEKHINTVARLNAR